MQGLRSVPGFEIYNNFFLDVYYVVIGPYGGVGHGLKNERQANYGWHRIMQMLFLILLRVALGVCRWCKQGSAHFVAARKEWNPIIGCWLANIGMLLDYGLISIYLFICFDTILGVPSLFPVDNGWMCSTISLVFILIVICWVLMQTSTHCGKFRWLCEANIELIMQKHIFMSSVIWVALECWESFTANILKIHLPVQTQ